MAFSYHPTYTFALSGFDADPNTGDFVLVGKTGSSNHRFQILGHNRVGVPHYVLTYHPRLSTSALGAVQFSKDYDHIFVLLILKTKYDAAYETDLGDHPSTIVKISHPEGVV